MHKSLLVVSVVSISLSASVYVPERLGSLTLSHDDTGFVVQKNGKQYPIEKESMDTMLRKMNKKQCALFMSKGRIIVDQASDGQYTLKSAAHLKGGGPISGAIAYWVTKSLCWGGVSIAAGAAVTGIAAATVATAGTAPGAIIASGCAYTAGITGAGTATAAAGAMALTTAGVSAATATTAVAATATGAGSAAALIASIETASMGASFAFTVCPFLP